MNRDHELLRLLKSKLKRGEPSDPRSERTASVAVAFKEGGHLKTLLIKRANREGDPWSGQVAFPGGRRGRNDRSPLETAIRETKEEVGIDLARSATYLGHLGTFRTHTGMMLVVPYAFLVLERVRVERNAEVASHRWVPVEAFLREGSRSAYILREGGNSVRLPAYLYRDFVIWGLTYRIISTLIAR